MVNGVMRIVNLHPSSFEVWISAELGNGGGIFLRPRWASNWSLDMELSRDPYLLKWSKKWWNGLVTPFLYGEMAENTRVCCNWVELTPISVEYIITPLITGLPGPTWCWFATWQNPGRGFLSFPKLPNLRYGLRKDVRHSQLKPNFILELTIGNFFCYAALKMSMSLRRGPFQKEIFQPLTFRGYSCFFSGVSSILDIIFGVHLSGRTRSHTWSRMEWNEIWNTKRNDWWNELKKSNVTFELWNEMKWHETNQVHLPSCADF